MLRVLDLRGRQTDATFFLVIRSVDQPGPTELWRVTPEGGEPQKLLEMDGLSDISVHPDGRHIAFTSGRIQMEIWAMENFLTLD